MLAAKKFQQKKLKKIDKFLLTRGNSNNILVYFLLVLYSFCSFIIELFIIHATLHAAVFA